MSKAGLFSKTKKNSTQVWIEDFWADWKFTSIYPQREWRFRQWALRARERFLVLQQITVGFYSSMSVSHSWN